MSHAAIDRSARQPALVQSLCHRKLLWVDCGAYHTVALGADGKVYAIGSNEEKQCGAHTPGLPAIIDVRPVTGIPAAVAVACGGAHTVAITQVPQERASKRGLEPKDEEAHASSPPSGGGRRRTALHSKSGVAQPTAAAAAAAASISFWFKDDDTMDVQREKRRLRLRQKNDPAQQPHPSPAYASPASSPSKLPPILHGPGSIPGNLHGSASALTLPSSPSLKANAAVASPGDGDGGGGGGGGGGLGSCESLPALSPDGRTSQVAPPPASTLRRTTTGVAIPNKVARVTINDEARASRRMDTASKVASEAVAGLTSAMATHVLAQGGVIVDTDGGDSKPGQGAGGGGQQPAPVLRRSKTQRGSFAAGGGGPSPNGAAGAAEHRHSEPRRGSTSLGSFSDWHGGGGGGGGGGGRRGSLQVPSNEVRVHALLNDIFSPAEGEGGAEKGPLPSPEKSLRTRKSRSHLSGLERVATATKLKGLGSSSRRASHQNAPAGGAVADPAAAAEAAEAEAGGVHDGDDESEGGAERAEEAAAGEAAAAGAKSPPAAAAQMQQQMQQMQQSIELSRAMTMMRYANPLQQMLLKQESDTSAEDRQKQAREKMETAATARDDARQSDTQRQATIPEEGDEDDADAEQRRVAVAAAAEASEEEEAEADTPLKKAAHAIDFESDTDDDLPPPPPPQPVAAAPTADEDVGGDDDDDYEADDFEAADSSRRMTAGAAGDDDSDDNAASKTAKAGAAADSAAVGPKGAMRKTPATGLHGAKLMMSHASPGARTAIEVTHDDGVVDRIQY